MVGKKPIKLTEKWREIDKTLDQTYQENDFKGFFAFGKNNNILYVCWHGSCQEYDWHSNLDQFLKKPAKNFLPYFPPHWEVHGGFGNIVHETWKFPQNIYYNNNNNKLDFSFEDILMQK